MFVVGNWIADKCKHTYSFVVTSTKQTKQIITMHVIIIGGGSAGISLAQALKKNNIEREPTGMGLYSFFIAIICN